MARLSRAARAHAGGRRGALDRGHERAAALPRCRGHAGAPPDGPGLAAARRPGRVVDRRGGRNRRRARTAGTGRDGPIVVAHGRGGQRRRRRPGPGAARRHAAGRTPPAGGAAVEPLQDPGCGGPGVTRRAGPPPTAAQRWSLSRTVVASGGAIAPEVRFEIGPPGDGGAPAKWGLAVRSDADQAAFAVTADGNVIVGGDLTIT